MPSPEQQNFLDRLDEALNADAPETTLRLLGGPGVGKSFTLSRAAERAAEAGWAVMLVGPTHQSVGVLAAAVPLAYPYEPDARTGLSAGSIVTATAHKMGQWVQKSRARGAAAGETSPVPRDSWLGRSLKLDWLNPPAGLLVLADEVSMYTHGMTRALLAVLATVRAAGARTVFVGIGDPFQLTPVRGDAYVLEPDEMPTSPSLVLSLPAADEIRLEVNQRAKHPTLRRVVDCYLNFQRVLPPPTGDEVYSWRHCGADLWAAWAEKIEQSDPGDCIILSYRRASVAFAGNEVHRLLHGQSAGDLTADRYMRVQSTYSPRGRTLAASSDLVRVVEVSDLDVDQIVAAILPPVGGHRAAHEQETLAVLADIVRTDVQMAGLCPSVTVEVLGDRAGLLRRIPASVASASEQTTASEFRWQHLQSALGHAAFRRRHESDTVRRGLAAIFYHVSDSARIRLEAPYAMTSHRAQGSTFKHVLVVADSPIGGELVSSPDPQTRHSSSYVMLSRASQSLTVGWAAR